MKIKILLIGEFISFSKEVEVDSIKNFCFPCNCYGYVVEGKTYIFGKEATDKDIEQLDENISCLIADCVYDKIAINKYGTFLLDEKDFILPDGDYR